MDFSSDNASGVHPAILEALARANTGTAGAYGNDAWTQRLQEALSEAFGRRVFAFPVATGTAANSLALAALLKPWGAAFVHREAHVAVDECGAPEFFSGGKLIEIGKDGARLSAATFDNAAWSFMNRGVHSVQPMALSFTQASETGQVFSAAEVRALCDTARAHRLAVHMDGARLANAAAHLRVPLGQFTCEVGVDLVSFGATKNGAMGAEALVAFDETRSEEIQFRRKQAGHLLSKLRFVSAQLCAYLEDGLWLALAGHANAMATALRDALAARAEAEIAYPVEANMVFVRLRTDLAGDLLKRGARFYPWSPLPENGRQLYRFVCSFQTTERDVAQFMDAFDKAALALR